CALPTDLKLVLTRLNGGRIPGGELLPAGTEPGTVHAELRALAKRSGRDPLDPELCLPFLRSDDGTLLAFDRAAGPLPDTWPVVDLFEESGADARLVYHSFDSWCRGMIARWGSPDFGEDLTLERYLNDGLLHVELEPDVASAHATVAHAMRRLGRPEDALDRYLKAGRCVPALPWVDWEALKLAALLGSDAAALEAGVRVSKRAPAYRWKQRDTTPVHVADVIGIASSGAAVREPWLACVDELAEQTRDDTERAHVLLVRSALLGKNPMPQPAPPSGGAVIPQATDAAAAWASAREAYLDGRLRDEHMLLDPSLRALGHPRKFVELLRLRREF
ncbi:MAG: SMI1/KNR4 family protein, partial [Myxococcales bacterium]|nr:SMI1/KNR4 family protein [Myxococcales bacterium]